MRRRRRRNGRLHLARPLPQGEALLVGLARRLEVEGGVIGQPQLHQRPRRPFIVPLRLQQGQRPLVAANGLLVRVQPPRPVPGLDQVIGSLSAAPGQLQVVGDQGGILTCSLATLLHQPVGHQAVVDPPQPLQHALVSHLAQDGLFEDVLLGPGKGRGLPLEDHLLAPQSRQVVQNLGFLHPLADRLADAHHGAVPEQPPHYRGLLQDGSLFRRQAVQAGLQDAGQGRRDAHGGQAGRLDAPALFSLDDHAVFDEHLDQFFDVKRVAFGPTDHQVAQGVGHMVHLLQDLGHQAAAVPPGEGL